MARTTAQRAESLDAAPEPEPIDTTNWPPLPEDVKAAMVRMAREPHLFDEFGDDDWVVFSGDEIIAGGPDYDEVIRTAEETGKSISLIVPIMGNWL